MIEEYPAAVPAELCTAIIAKFEDDPRKGPSSVGNYGRVSDHRRGTLMIVNHDLVDWQPLVKEVFPHLQRCVGKYAEKYESFKLIANGPGIVLRYPLIERTTAAGGFDWHMDVTSDTTTRVLAMLLYLNDVKSAGFTEFKYQDHRVRPQTGKVLLFPPYWTHFHRGVPPTEGEKYVMSFFWTYPPEAAAAPTPEKRGWLDRLRGR